MVSPLFQTEMKAADVATFGSGVLTLHIKKVPALLRKDVL